MPEPTEKRSKEMSSRRKKIGDILISAGLITQEQMKEALQMQAASGERLGKVLIEMNFLTEEDLVRALSQQLGLPSIDLSTISVPDDLMSLLSESFLIKHQVIPIERTGNIIKLAMGNPLDQSVLRDVEFMAGSAVQPVVASPSSIERFLLKRVSKDTLTAFSLSQPSDRVEVMEDSESEVDMIRLKNASETQAIIRSVNRILTDAIKAGSNTIHIEPHQKETLIRYRMDGLLRNSTTLPAHVLPIIACRVKTLCKMDIADRRRPQNGKARINIAKQEFELDISTLPTLFGEKIVIRILGKSQQLMTLEDLGMSPVTLNRYRSLLSRPRGMIVVAGPIRSGTTTTLYASLRHIRADHLNVMTIEDPVENNLPGVNQVQVNQPAGITFSSGLLSILHQDPDVIMVGDIRGPEVAEIVFQASLTGHLVLSNIRTQNAVSAIFRLKDLNIRSYLIASSLAGVIAQRLVRRNCPHCQEPYTPNPDIMATLNFNIAKSSERKFFRGRGCKTCNNTGYLGQIGIYEVLIIDNTLKEMIMNRAPERKMLLVARAGGMTTMEENGLYLCVNKITTPEEILRVIPPGEISGKIDASGQ